MQTKSFVASIDAVGNGTIHADSKDISSDLVGFDLICRANQATQIVLHLAPRAIEIQAEGLLFEHTRDPLIMLDMLDLDEIQEIALERLGWGDSKTITQHLIDVIREKINESEP